MEDNQRAISNFMRSPLPRGFNINTHQFDVAVSFPGEYRDLVLSVLEHLATLIDPNSIFYDLRYESRTAGSNGASLLQDIYRKRTKLNVLFLSKEYEEKAWCGWEYRAIHELVFHGEYNRVLPIKLDDSDMELLQATDIYLSAKHYTHKELAEKIHDRLISIDSPDFAEVERLRVEVAEQATELEIVRAAADAQGVELEGVRAEVVTRTAELDAVKEIMASQVVELEKALKAPRVVVAAHPELVQKLLKTHPDSYIQSWERLCVTAADICWIVLDYIDNEVLLLAEKVLKTQSYHSPSEDVTWEDSSLRQYLNKTFLNGLGSIKPAVVKKRNDNLDNPWYGTNGCNDTYDKVFLLSLSEVVRYFGDSGSLDNRQGSSDYFSDQYDETRIAYTVEGKALWWWLRSPGNSGNGAAIVRADGTVCVDGYRVYSAYGGVRPALWLNLDLISSHLITIN